ncbi:hypothetical protein [Anaerosphaera multitolerans]|uniref:hypothetical protein n=1 Tax=Anaerosphaera multitolerans TaxID=2487351 RepID=UPI0013E340F4|nr:hypothetical protein [Anaerosphaera multitolerans]
MMDSKRLTRQQAIRKKCLDCSGQSFKEVKECPIKKCPLYRYRLGYEEKGEVKNG